MRKLFGFVFFVVITAGLVWHQSQPTTVRVPVEAEEVLYERPGYYQETTTTTELAETTLPQQPDVSFAEPDVTLEVVGDQGDAVTVQQVFGEPTALSEAPPDVWTVLMSCPGVTDRSMVMQIDAKVELKSSLAAKFMVNYHTSENPAVFSFDSGPACSEGRVDYDLEVGGNNQLTYWVALRGAITPNYPAGDFVNRGWALDGLSLTLPTIQTATWQMWGPHVVSCESESEIWLAGVSLVGTDDCRLATTADLAVGTM